MTPEEIIKAIQNTGMVGLGGATFPTHVKLSPPEGFPIDTVLVNGCECEPYITSDHRIMLEDTADLIQGTRIVLKAVGAKRAIIGVEDNKLDAVAAIRAKLPQGISITVETVQTKYPQGAEKMLIKALLDREVPSGGFPYHIGVSPFNVTTLAQLGALVPRGQGLIERVVTVSGSGVEHPGNYIVALGTPLRFVLEQVGYYGGHDRLIFGGPMMGMSVSSLDVPVTKGISSIVVQTEQEQIDNISKKVYPCIRCAACVKACPIHLNPSQLGLLAAKHEYELMAQRYHLNDCFECGSCSYVCPSGIPLVQYFRIAKSINRERQV
jgi:electron transport complex protein RnfC